MKNLAPLLFSFLLAGSMLTVSCRQNGKPDPISEAATALARESAERKAERVAKAAMEEVRKEVSASVESRPKAIGKSGRTPAGSTTDVGLPVGDNGIHLTRSAYSVSYDKDMRIPIWVAWKLTKEHTQGNYKREGIKFAEDMDVPAPRATNMDYVNSGYDRGHMCPSGDNKWSEKAQVESFLYTNCCPQLHNLNAGDWNELEGKCRTWAQKYGQIYIVCGPVLFNQKHKTIGKNKVVVPEAFFKVVLCMEGKPKAIGFIYRNTIANRKMASYVNTVDQVERITGLDFFSALPDDIESRVEANADLDEWN